jgi:cyclopropane fatty-acyl-phospholipid synthase-like methyltransferase
MRAPDYYDNMTPEEWRPILGDDLHYHFGFYEDGMTFEDGLRWAVRRLLPFLDNGPRVLDIGCGWGGPARELVASGYDVCCVTNSERQHGYCRLLGLRAELLDVEQNDLDDLGRVDSLFMMESLEHIFDKKRLLHTLTGVADRLVLVTNCHTFAVREPLVAFGNTCLMLSVTTLLETLEAAGWHVRHAANVRAHSMPTLGHWKARIDATYPTGMKAAVKMLLGLCDDALENREHFEASFPLLAVAADRIR